MGWSIWVFWMLSGPPKAYFLPNIIFPATIRGFHCGYPPFKTFLPFWRGCIRRISLFFFEGGIRKIPVRSMCESSKVSFEAGYPQEIFRPSAVWRGVSTEGGIDSETPWYKKYGFLKNWIFRVFFDFGRCNYWPGSAGNGRILPKFQKKSEFSKIHNFSFSGRKYDCLAGNRPLGPGKH